MMALGHFAGSLAVAAALWAAAPGFARADDEPARAEERAEMVAVIEDGVRRTRTQLGRSALSPRVIAAMDRVARHELVPEDVRRDAYRDRPLPIGYGQTISQPYIVAIMTDLVDVGPDSRVLEIGTGSGYQAAVLAEVAGEVYTLEIIPELAQRARRDLERLGYENVTAREGDGYFGWEAHAPFDAIVVTAGASHVPPPLIEQLAPGGRLIIPVGSRFLTQQLLLLSKAGDGSVSTRQVLPVRFVPLTGSHDRP
jgi:protein-L-isoaspartate(D-aspartate) O-methyltransferase